MSGHSHSALEITEGTFNSSRLPTIPVSKGGTGRTTLTYGYFLRGAGTSAVTLSSIDEVRDDLGINNNESFGNEVGDIILSARDLADDENYLPCDGQTEVTEELYPNLYPLLGINPTKEPDIILSSNISANRSTLTTLSSTYSVGSDMLIDKDGQAVCFNMRNSTMNYSRISLNGDITTGSTTINRIGSSSENYPDNPYWACNKQYAISWSGRYDESSGWDFPVFVYGGNGSINASSSGVVTVSGGDSELGENVPTYFGSGRIYYVKSTTSGCSVKMLTLGTYSSPGNSTYIIDSIRETHLTGEQSRTVIISVSGSSTSNGEAIIATISDENQGKLYLLNGNAIGTGNGDYTDQQLNTYYTFESIAYAGTNMLYATAELKTNGKYYFLVLDKSSSNEYELVARYEFSYNNGQCPVFFSPSSFANIDPSEGIVFDFGNNYTGIGRLIGNYMHIHSVIQSNAYLALPNQLWYIMKSGSTIYKLTPPDEIITTPDVMSNYGIGWIRCK